MAGSVSFSALEGYSCSVGTSLNANYFSECAAVKVWAVYSAALLSRRVEISSLRTFTGESDKLSDMTLADLHDIVSVIFLAGRLIRLLIPCLLYFWDFLDVSERVVLYPFSILAELFKCGVWI